MQCSPVIFVASYKTCHISKYSSTHLLCLYCHILHVQWWDSTYLDLSLFHCFAWNLTTNCFRLLSTTSTSQYNGSSKPTTILCSCCRFTLLWLSKSFILCLPRQSYWPFRPPDLACQRSTRASRFDRLFCCEQFLTSAPWSGKTFIPWTPRRSYWPCF